MTLQVDSSIYFLSVCKSLVKLLIAPHKWKLKLSQVNVKFKLLKLALTPRYTATSVNLFGGIFKLVDSASFLWTYYEIFDSEIYNFNSETRNPVIIDCGANIGLSILYLKKIYPESHIIAFEPDSNIFKTLEENIKNFNLSDIELFRKAVWKSEGFLEFASEGSDAGRLSEEEESESDVQKYKVPTVRLGNYLKKPVDFLKIDIEGAETEVLTDCQEELVNVKNIFVEYHSFADKPQSLDVLINILSKAGFRVYVQTLCQSPQPLHTIDVLNGMDMQLNIFGVRESLQEKSLTSA